MLGYRRSRDTTKYCQFHEDHGHDINDCRELRHQIEEGVKSGQLYHIVKGIKKGKAKVPDTQRGDRKKEKDTSPVKAPILMISRREPAARRVSTEEPMSECWGITFPPVIKSNNSSASVIIKAKILGRQVNRVYMDIGSSCEVIYEHCFLKLNPSIMSNKLDSKVPLVGFSGEHSWPIGEVLLEITIGDAPFTRMETLNFVIVRSTSPHNLLFGRTTMQKMGIVVSTIHGAIKFHTPRGIGTVLSTCKSDEEGERSKRLKEVSSWETEDIFSCTDAEERIIVNDKYLEQTVIIGRHLPTNFKEKLQDLLKSNADVFAWTHADMTGIPRTITVRGKPF
ncbi:reverse transcriptase domain-containing protein [Tanacetum coccineum]